MITYGEDAKTPPTERSASCLDNCHEKKMGKLEGMEWTGSVHTRSWTEGPGNVREMSCDVLR